MPIYGISDFKRLPRLGKIKLGRKEKSSKGTEYPIQTRFFVCPEEVQAIYGPEPTELDIMFPLNNIDLVFPQDLKLYGKSGLKCKGDGRNATMMVDGKLVEKTCTPGAKECKGCKPIGTLNVLLSDVPGFGVWQIWTSSWNSIVNLNSSIDMIKAMTGGRIAYIPLKLQLQEHNAIVPKPDGTQFQKKVYVMTINISQTMSQFYEEHSLEANHMRSLENPGYARLALMNEGLQNVQPQGGVIDLEDDDEEWEVITEEEEPAVKDDKPIDITPVVEEKPEKQSTKKTNGKSKVNWNSFWGTVGALGYNEAQVHEIAGVESLTDFTQTEINGLLLKLRKMKEDA